MTPYVDGLRSNWGTSQALGQKFRDAGAYKCTCEAQKDIPNGVSRSYHLGDLVRSLGPIMPLWAPDEAVYTEGFAQAYRPPMGHSSTSKDERACNFRKYKQERVPQNQRNGESCARNGKVLPCPSSQLPKMD